MQTAPLQRMQKNTCKTISGTILTSFHLFWLFLFMQFSTYLSKRYYKLPLQKRKRKEKLGKKFQHNRPKADTEKNCCRIYLTELQTHLKNSFPMNLNSNSKKGLSVRNISKCIFSVHIRYKQWFSISAARFINVKGCSSNGGCALPTSSNLFNP